MSPFVPQPLPRDDLDWGELVPLIARSNRAIARYDGIVHGLVNPLVLLSPLAAREAGRETPAGDLCSLGPDRDRQCPRWKLFLRTGPPSKP